jgi:hypothetical protein
MGGGSDLGRLARVSGGGYGVGRGGFGVGCRCFVVEEEGARRRRP